MSNEHTVKSYEEELQFLKDSLIKMGSLTESQLSDAMDAVIKVDKDSIDKIIKSDEEINKFRSKIDTQIMNLLVKRAPMAIDLRETISSLKISQDLERIGDLSKSNAKKVKPLPLDLPDELLGNLKRLGELVMKQLNDVLDSYVNKNFSFHQIILGLLYPLVYYLLDIRPLLNNILFQQYSLYDRLLFPNFL